MSPARRTRTGKTSAWARTCPAPGRSRRFKVTSVAAVALARRRQLRQVPARLRHRVLRQEAARRAFKQTRRSQEARPSRLGPQLGLFAIDDAGRPGADALEAQGRGGSAGVAELHQPSILRRQGYQQVFTPHIGRLDLYKTRGHYPYYRESQFPPLVDREMIDMLAKENCGCGELSNRMEKGDIDGYLLKPMNCPMHIQIYASEQHSYRDLPDAAGGIRHRLSLGKIRRAGRHDPRARLHPG